MRTVAYALLGVVAALLAAEAALRVLPVSTSSQTGYYLDPAVVTYPPGHTWRAATGWDMRNGQVLHANNAGFAAHRDFVPDDAAVGLVGDSFVEASMLDAPDRPGMQLERTLAGRPVYAMGGPGSALLDYAERIRLASTQWGVRDFVVLMERGDIRQSLCGSGNNHSPCLDRQTLQLRSQVQSAPTTLKRWLRHSALAQYLVSQLKLDTSRLLSQALQQARTSPEHAAPAVAREPVADHALVDAVTQTFLARALPHVKGRLVLIVDANRRSATPDPERDRFIALARAAGVTVIDAAPIYKAHYAHSSLKLEVGPYDAHLNALAIGLLMDAAGQALRTSN